MCACVCVKIHTYDGTGLLCVHEWMSESERVNIEYSLLSKSVQWPELRCVAHTSPTDLDYIFISRLTYHHNVKDLAQTVTPM